MRADHISKKGKFKGSLRTGEPRLAHGLHMHLRMRSLPTRKCPELTEISSPLHPQWLGGAKAMSCQVRSPTVYNSLPLQPPRVKASSNAAKCWSGIDLDAFQNISASGTESMTVANNGAWGMCCISWT
mmetsp:Transcript_46347/g.107027  ORF Transcript_46347/g.107027 Transcript_46347/m.107027 type:complete len:128 (+) Transcript_46347:189-572(+)